MGTATPIASEVDPLASSQTMSMRGFVHELGSIDRHDSSQSFVFLLGAGASVTSGIPAARTLVDRWLKELHQQDADHGTLAFPQWMQKGHHGIEGIDPSNPAASYCKVYDRRFGSNPSHGYAVLTSLMKDAQPGFGYSVLATMLAKERHKAVITTNFDSLIERALLYYTNYTPLTCTHETTAGVFTKTLMRPLIVKCHRDLLLDPLNGAQETRDLPESYGQALKSLLPGKVLITIGYGGNDDSLMDFFAHQLGADHAPAAVYWCYWEPGGPPDARVRSWVADQGGWLVPIPGFDELMAGVNAEFGFGFLEQQMEKQHNDRIRRYKEQVEQIAKKQPSPSQPVAASQEDPEVAASQEDPGDDITPDAPTNSGVSTGSDTLDLTESHRTVRHARIGFSGLDSASSGELQKKVGRAKSPSTRAQPRPGDSLARAPKPKAHAVEPPIGDAISFACESISTTVETGDHTKTPWMNLLSTLSLADPEVKDKAFKKLMALAPNELAVLERYAEFLEDQHRYTQAEALRDEAVEQLRTQKPADQERLATNLAKRAWLRRLVGKPQQAYEDIAFAVDWARSHTPGDEQGLAILYATRADIRRVRGDLDGAYSDIHKSIDWLKSQSPRDERSLAINYATRAGIRRALGDLLGASADIQKSINWLELQSPRDERGLAHWYARRGRIKYDRGKIDQAVEDISRAVTGLRDQEPVNEYRLAHVLRAQGHVLAAAGDWDGAKAAIEQSVQLHVKRFGAGHEWTARAKRYAVDINAGRVPGNRGAQAPPRET